MTGFPLVLHCFSFKALVFLWFWMVFYSKQWFSESFGKEGGVSRENSDGLLIKIQLEINGIRWGGGGWPPCPWLVCHTLLCCVVYACVFYETLPLRSSLIRNQRIPCCCDPPSIEIVEILTTEESTRSRGVDQARIWDGWFWKFWKFWKFRKICKG